MEPVARPRIKICCIQSVEEARLAVRYGAAALGLVSRMPSGPGPIPEDAIARIAAATPPPVLTVLLTCAPDAAEVAAQSRRTGAAAVQLCDRLEKGTAADIRRAQPGVRVIQVVHVTGPKALEEARTAEAGGADAVLLDSGDRSGPVKRLGGTGRCHDWSTSRRIREALQVPVFLAGGLTSENAREAVETVGPFALDVCTGVRTDGKLDETRLAAFVAALNR